MESKLLLLLLLRFICVIAMFRDFARGMGLCEFEELFACEKRSGCRSISVKSEAAAGSTKSSTPLPTTHRSVNSYSTSDPLVISKTVPGSTKDSNTLLITHRPLIDSTTTNLLPTTPMCPPNMVYTNCTCQGTCQDPSGCHTNCSNLETCVCPSGFLMKGEACVRQEDCECFIEGYGVLEDNGVYINSVCTKRCTCAGDTLSCNTSYSCDKSAFCEEINNVGRCLCNASFTGDGITCVGPHSDCSDIFNAGNTEDGVYTVIPTDWPGEAIEVYCNMSNGGGWTVFQRRVNGSEDFNRTWQSYKAGFGALTHEFWIGNTKLYYLSKQKTYQLRIDVVSEDDVPLNLTYSSFRIANKNSNFRLEDLGNFTGSTGYDYMDFHRNQDFSTFDNDNDAWPMGNCPLTSLGGWWYQNCFAANLNGEYHTTNVTGVGFRIRGTKKISFYRYAQMKMRPL